MVDPNVSQLELRRGQGYGDDVHAQLLVIS